MFIQRRKNRPVQWGPYPFETLPRDASRLQDESVRAPLDSVGPDNALPQKPLGLASRKYRDAFGETRMGETFAGKAPVPKDLDLRAADLKGAAYFFDSSHAGICKVPPNAWLRDRQPLDGHDHALVIMVEYSAPVDPDNLAADWVAGEEHGLALTRAAEIAAIMAGYIGALGFSAQAHWAENTEVDVDRLIVLAGLGLRTPEGVVSPFLGRRYAAAAVTTPYEASCDLPLGAGALDAKGLGYFLGLSGAVSGLERWRRSRRPSHLGPYPVECLKRRERPTTEIFDEEVPRIPARAMFYVRAERGDMGEKALKERPRWAYKHPLSQGILRIMWKMVPFQGGVQGNDQAPETADPARNSKALKALSHYLGSAVTGICEMPDYVWYSHRKNGEAIKPYHRYAVTMLIDQGHETFDGACGDDFISGSQSMRAYMRGAEISGIMADHLRRLGFSARAQTNLDSDVLHVPLVLLSGLGEQSRIGESALNPFLGPRFKTVVLTTDMPLEPDKPIDFGLQTFCSKCVKCARECPSMAIPFGKKVIFNGYETWKPDSEKCTRYRMLNLKGSACGRCIKTCPLTKDITWDGPWLTRLGSWLGLHALWLKPILAPIAIWVDDKLGHGNPNDAKKWWLDLEVSGKRCLQVDTSNVCVTPPNGVNRKKIRPDRKIDPTDQKIAYYPASVVPPPDDPGPYPADRALGLEIAARAETVQQGLDRRRRGEPPPSEYRIRW